VIGIWTLPAVGQLERLSVPDLSQNGHFGRAHSINRGTIFVAEPNYSTDSLRRVGRVHVFEKNGSTWTSTASLGPAEQRAYGQFGHAVVVDDTHLAVSAPNINSGSVYLYHFQDGSWEPTQEITIPDVHQKAGHHFRFGEQVRLLGDWLIISAPGYPTSEGDKEVHGAIFTFKKEGKEWLFQQSIFPIQTNKNTAFGFDVELSDAQLVISAPEADGGATESGVVYLFKFESGAWVLDYTLINPFSKSHERFGAGIDVYNQTIAVGVPMHTEDAGSGPGGGMHVFQKVDDTWLRTAFLTPQDGHRNDLFGQSVAIERGFICVGAPRADHEAFVDMGKVYLFELQNGFWIETKTYVPPVDDYQHHAQFGSHLDVYEDQLVVSAHLLNNALDDSGVAYTVDLDLFVATEDPTRKLPDVKIYPIPTADLLHVDVNGTPGNTTNYRIYAADGRMPDLQVSASGDRWQCDVSSLNAGTYFIYISDGKHISIHKWIKI
jgi:hypothetical protein